MDRSYKGYDMKSKIWVACAFVACLGLVGVVGVFIWNHVSLQQKLDDVVSADPRNSGIECKVHFRNYIDADIIVFDLRRVGGDKSPADVFRVLLQFAERVKAQRYQLVELEYQGSVRFLVDGGYFRRLGREYGSQNPVYTMRTFPEHVQRPDGEPAFSSWAGGLLGVISRQMDDFNEFHRQWYIGDVAGGR